MYNHIRKNITTENEPYIVEYVLL